MTGQVSQETILDPGAGQGSAKCWVVLSGVV
jgi:hypothetical protein